MNRHSLLPALAAFLLALQPLRAADPVETADTRLRETLRGTLEQLHEAQAQLAALQATQQSVQAEGDHKLKELTAQRDALSKQLIDDKATADKTISDDHDNAQKQATEIDRLTGELAAQKTAFEQADALARAREGARAKLDAQNQVLQRLLADRESKNIALFKLGSEILTRYEKFSLGEALAAKEPFVGLTRVKLENLVQDYEEKLSDQRIHP
jgi:septal ring factor EnvC (AmiA/AmiB activator)